MPPKLVWNPSPNFSARNARVDLLVLHDCEGSYEGSIAYFRMRESQVSAHFVARDDGSEVTQMVDLADKAWHAMAFNSRSIGWEMAGYAKAGFSPALLDATAAAFAYLCHHLQIPVRHARGGVGPGIESHWGLGAAGGGHSDPSRDPAFMERFVAQVAAHAAKGDFPLSWEPDRGDAPCLLTPGGASAPVKAALDLNTVAGVRQALVALGYGTSLGPSGYLDTVRAFQRHAGLSADGIAGPLTQAAIRKDLSGG